MLYGQMCIVMIFMDVSFALQCNLVCLCKYGAIVTTYRLVLVYVHVHRLVACLGKINYS